MPNSLIIMVGTTGFEPATTCPPGMYSTGLNYVPQCKKEGLIAQPPVSEQ